MNILNKLFSPGKLVDDSFNLSFLGTDIHSHLIPDVDDGARSIDESVEYIRALKELGYNKLIITPHVQTNVFDNDNDNLYLRLEDLKKRVKEQNIDIELQLGAEYILDASFSERIKKKNLLTFGKNHILVESFHSQASMNFNELVYELQSADYNIILAHPERYLYWDINSTFFKELKNKGILFQMNILSLGGYYGHEVKKRSIQLLKSNFIELLGTDLHNHHYLKHIINTCKQVEFQEIIENYRFLNSEF